MSDDDVQREIEANERRVRDEKDVGLDEDVLQDPDNLDGDVNPLLDVFDVDNDRTREEEFSDNNRANDNGV